ncbi:uncharacterized protein LOC143895897 isoform X2 [Temnothorax americanus]|uniref:uncharacterized protein LOC143895897 isoform X2 n=1 Tax=Temnothorax americanus TaxID=1964332 RepID=UPI00406905B3
MSATVKSERRRRPGRHRATAEQPRTRHLLFNNSAAAHRIGKCLDNKNNLLHPDSVRNSSCVSRLLLAKVLKMERFKPLLTYIENIRPMRRSDENIEANRLSMPARNHWLLLSGTMTEMQG